MTQSISLEVLLKHYVGNSKRTLSSRHVAKIVTEHTYFSKDAMAANTSLAELTVNKVLYVATTYPIEILARIGATTLTMPATGLFTYVVPDGKPPVFFTLRNPSLTDAIKLAVLYA